MAPTDGHLLVAPDRGTLNALSKTCQPPFPLPFYGRVERCSHHLIPCPMSTSATPPHSTTPLLSYTVATIPDPLVVSAPGQIGLTAQIADPAVNQAVAIESIVIDFGSLSATGASDLTNTHVSGWTSSQAEIYPLATTPVLWPAPKTSGLAATFSPPAANPYVTASQSIQFTFTGIPINQTPGSVQVKIKETSAVGQTPPSKTPFPPSATPTPAAVQKAPDSFSPPEFTSAASVDADVPYVLSWQGGAPAGATYTLDFVNGTTNFNSANHGNGTTPFAGTDSYPNSTDGDPAQLLLSASTIFTLRVSYTPTGAASPYVWSTQFTVSVVPATPTITSFTATPTFLDFTSGNLQPLTLAWVVANAPGEAPVMLAVQPELDANEQAAAENAVLGTPRSARSSRKVKFDQSHVVTLTATGPGMGNSAQGSLTVYQQPVIQAFTASPSFICANPESPAALTLAWQVGQTSGATPVMITVQPPLDATEQALSSNAVFGAPQAASGSAAVQFDQPHLVTLTAQGQGVGNTMSQISEVYFGRPPVSTKALPNNNEICSIATIIDSQYALASDGINTLTVVTLSGSPTQWVITPLQGPYNGIQGIVITPNGTYALIPSFYNDAVIAITLQGSPNQWSTTQLNGSFRRATCIAITTDSQYALVGTGGNQVTVITLDKNQTPDQWSSIQLSHSFDQLMSIAVTPDGKYALILTQGDSNVTVIELTGEPVQWTIIQLDLTFNASMQIALTPDSHYALVLCSLGDVVALILEGPPRGWIVSSPVVPAGSDNNGSVAVTPDGRFALVGGCDSLIGIALTGTPSQWSWSYFDSTATYSFGGPVAVTPDGQFALIPSNSWKASNVVINAIQLVPPPGCSV